MAGLVPAIRDLSRGTKNVDARDKPGHDEFVAGMPTKDISAHAMALPQMQRLSTLMVQLLALARPVEAASRFTATTGSLSFRLLPLPGFGS